MKWVTRGHARSNHVIRHPTSKGHPTYDSTRLDERNTMVVNSFSYLFKQRFYHRKTFFAENDIYDLSWPLMPKRLTLGQIWGHVSEREFQELFYWHFRICSSSYTFRDNGDNMNSCHAFRKFGNFFSFSTPGDVIFDFREKTTEIVS